jgi:oxygen-independent coproporphyrinogen III oxidase
MRFSAFQVAHAILPLSFRAQREICFFLSAGKQQIPRSCAPRNDNLESLPTAGVIASNVSARNTRTPDAIIIAMPVGLYISVPFCRTKCSYCNFASDVFSRTVFERYTQRVCSDLEHAAETAGKMGGRFESAVDSVYLGGGTPTVLDINQLERLFVTISQNFEALKSAEITVECAPGTLTPAVLEALQRGGVNRVSLGVQSFVDREAAAVGRLHKKDIVLDDIRRLRAAGISNLNVDLLAGLPHQTADSWESSLTEVIASGAPHVSVYMLEVDEDSRLGRELIAGGTKYHAHFVPDEDQTADFYVAACERLEAAGVKQYEISNFARQGSESRHNLKYWTRQPYLGFGVDAHSMLQVQGEIEAVRFSTPDSLDGYVRAMPLTRTPVSRHAALEEAFFLGLRLNAGVDLWALVRQFGEEALQASSAIVTEFVSDGLLQRERDVIRLTPRGRLLSNEVFARFISTAASAV